LLSFYIWLFATFSPQQLMEKVAGGKIPPVFTSVFPDFDGFSIFPPL